MKSTYRIRCTVDRIKRLNQVLDCITRVPSGLVIKDMQLRIIILRLDVLILQQQIRNIL